jgi:hypothetical protein
MSLPRLIFVRGTKTNLIPVPSNIGKLLSLRSTNLRKHGRNVAFIHKHICIFIDSASNRDKCIIIRYLSFKPICSFLGSIITFLELLSAGEMIVYLRFMNERAPSRLAPSMASTEDEYKNMTLCYEYHVKHYTP